jgi:hypothetical protein
MKTILLIMLFRVVGSQDGESVTFGGDIVIFNGEEVTW